MRDYYRTGEKARHWIAAWLLILLLVAAGTVIYTTASRFYGLIAGTSQQQGATALSPEQGLWQIATVVAQVPTPTPPVSPTASAAPSVTPSQAPQATESPTQVPSPSASATASQAPTQAPTATSTPQPTSTVVPSPTASATPTVSPTPLPTFTPQPTATVSPTPDPSTQGPTWEVFGDPGRRADLIVPPAPLPQGYSPQDGLPACPPHDFTVGGERYHWHAHVEFDSSGKAVCHHWHIHGDNPEAQAVQAVFGDFTSAHILGYTSGIPWATGQKPNGALPAEQERKHEGYWWDTEIGLRCDVFAGWACITDYAILVHAVPNHTTGNAGSIHSLTGVVRACKPDPNNPGQPLPGTCGTLFTGMHTYFGVLFADYHGSYVPRSGIDPDKLDVWTSGGGITQLWPYLAGDKPPLNWAGEPWIWGGDPCVQSDGERNPTNQCQHLWVDIRVTNPNDMVNVNNPSYSDPQQPPHALLRCQPPCQRNGSWRDLNTVEARIPRSWDNHTGDGQTIPEDMDPNPGYVSFSTYTEANGVTLAPHCTSPGPNCVPFVANHWPVVDSWAIMDSDKVDAGTHPQAYPRIRDMGDWSPAAQGTGTEWWINGMPGIVPVP